MPFLQNGRPIPHFRFGRDQCDLEFGFEAHLQWYLANRIGNPPAMAKDPNVLPAAAPDMAIAAFLRQVAAAPNPMKLGNVGRLIFAIDATASRQQTWNRACRIQAEMFSETVSLGGLAIQMCYFRGIGEFRVTPWLTDSQALIGRMAEVTCASGNTQIIRVLRHTIVEADKGRVSALVYIGDAMEENAVVLADLSGKLGVLGVPMFVFQEGDEPNAGYSFRQMAQLTHGAYIHFDTGSAETLRDLLKAVAVYAAGGRKALTEYAERSGADALRLLQQLK